MIKSKDHSIFSHENDQYFYKYHKKIIFHRDNVIKSDQKANFYCKKKKLNASVVNATESFEFEISETTTAQR